MSLYSTISAFIRGTESVKIKTMMVCPEFSGQFLAIRFSGSVQTAQIANEIETKLARMQVAVLNLLIELRQNYIKQEKQNTVKRENFKIVENSIDFIHKNYNKKLNLDYIAQNIYCNKYSLSRNFKAVTSVTVVDYINFYRCTKASSLISEGMSVSAAAEKCGFNNIPFL